MAFDIVLTCARRVEREVELVLPSEFETGLAHGIVAYLCARMAFRKVGGVGCDFICDYTVTDILKVGEGEMFLRGDIAYHCSSHPCYLGCTDCGGDVVIAGSDVSCQRAESIEWCFMAFVNLTVHVLADFVHGDMAGTFDKHLYIVAPCDFGQFAEHVEFEELRTVVGIMD